MRSSDRKGEPKPLVIYDTGMILQAPLLCVDAVMSNRLRAEYERVLPHLRWLYNRCMLRAVT
ncbi:MAG: hypothetical protein H7145_00580 [Akkermansiaceae bacterium]|nr:hypothetical protein [Armatimonadota bacterium]